MILYPFTYYLFTSGKMGRQVLFFLMILSGMTGIIFPSVDWMARQAIMHLEGEGLPLQVWSNILTIGGNPTLLFYFLAGAFLLEYHNCCAEETRYYAKKVRYIIAFVTTGLGIIGLVVVKYIESGLFVWGDTYLGFGYVRISTVLLTMGVYLWVELLTSHGKNVFTRVVGEQIGRCTLGIYYAHYLVLTVFSWSKWKDICMQHYFMGMNVIKTVIVAILCWGFTVLIKKVPLFRKVV